MQTTTAFIRRTDSPRAMWVNGDKKSVNFQLIAQIFKH